MSGATDRPWTVELRNQATMIHAHSIKSGNLYVADVRLTGDTEALANAELIVRAVNCHQELLEALKALTARASKDAETYAKEGNEPIWAFISDASTAIAKAEGR